MLSIRKRIGRIKTSLSRLPSLKNRTRYNRLKLQAKLENSEKNSASLRRRKKLTRILLFATLSVAISSLCYCTPQVRTFIVTIGSKFSKNHPIVSDPDTVLETSNKNNTLVSGLLAHSRLVASLVFVAALNIGLRLAASESSTVSVQPPAEKYDKNAMVLVYHICWWLGVSLINRIFVFIP